jgi:site-specific recombinase XerD
VDYFKDEYIYNGLYKTPEKMRTKGRGKIGKQLNRYTIVSYFKPYLELWLKEREELGIDSEWLFVGKDKKSQLTTSLVDSWLDSIDRMIDKPVFCHLFRHNYTTMLIKAGIPANIIKEIVGWESLEMVSRYTHLELTDEIGKYFDGDGVVQQEKQTINNL